MSDIITKLNIRKNLDDTYYLFVGYSDDNFVEIPRCVIKEGLNELFDKIEFEPLTLRDKE
jgi:hypothetical protein